MKIVDSKQKPPGHVDTFRLFQKSLNGKSVKAANGDPAKVIPIAARHNTRELKAEFCTSDGRIAPSKCYSNYALVGPMNAAAIMADAKQVMLDAGVKKVARSDCIMAVEVVFSLPAGTAIDTVAYFKECLAWVDTAYGACPIISAIVHLDEACPHMHVLLVPVVDGRMQGHKVCGFAGVLAQRTDAFHVAVAAKYGLAKPNKKPRLKHVETNALADSLLDLLVSGSPAMQGNPVAQEKLRDLLAHDPVPLAKALKVKLRQEAEPATASLCNAVEDMHVSDLWPPS